MSTDRLSLEEIMQIIHTATSIPTELNLIEPDNDNGLIEIGEATVILGYLKYFLEYYYDILDSIADELVLLESKSNEFIEKSNESKFIDVQAGLLWDYSVFLIQERFHFNMQKIGNFAISKSNKLLIQLVNESDQEPDDLKADESNNETGTSEPTSEETRRSVDDEPLKDPLDFSNRYKYRQTDKLN